MKSSKNKGQKGQLPKSKPFCDCEYCECANCPDVLKKLALQSMKCHKTAVRAIGAKNNKIKKKKEPPPPPRPPSILDTLNPDRNCDCEVMARAIRPHIHQNIGMQDRNSRPSEQRPSNSKDTD